LRVAILLSHGRGERPHLHSFPTRRSSDLCSTGVHESGTMRLLIPPMATPLRKSSSNFGSRSLPWPRPFLLFAPTFFVQGESRMKRVALLLCLAFLAGAGWLVPLASSQDHFQI